MYGVYVFVNTFKCMYWYIYNTYTNGNKYNAKGNTMSGYRKPQPAFKTVKCRTCGRKTITGLDGRRAALPVVIDPEVLTRDAELVYIVIGVPVYGMNRNGDIIRRNSAEVLKHPATMDMHRVHDCDNPTPAEFVKPVPPPEPTAPTSEEVPF